MEEKPELTYARLISISWIIDNSMTWAEQPEGRGFWARINAKIYEEAEKAYRQKDGDWADWHKTAQEHDPMFKRLRENWGGYTRAQRKREGLPYAAKLIADYFLYKDRPDEPFWLEAWSHLMERARDA